MVLIVSCSGRTTEIHHYAPTIQTDPVANLHSPQIPAQCACLLAREWLEGIKSPKAPTLVDFSNGELESLRNLEHDTHAHRPPEAPMCLRAPAPSHRSYLWRKKCALDDRCGSGRCSPSCHRGGERE